MAGMGAGKARLFCHSEIFCCELLLVRSQVDTYTKTFLLGLLAGCIGCENYTKRFRVSHFIYFEISSEDTCSDIIFEFS